MLKRIFVLLVVLCSLGALQNRATAQSRDGWAIDLEPMWMNVKGFDQHNGDVVRTHECPDNQSVAIDGHQNPRTDHEQDGCGNEISGQHPVRASGLGRRTQRMVLFFGKWDHRER